MKTKEPLFFLHLSAILRGHDKEELIEHIFDFSSHIQYGDAKFQILSSLVPNLYGSKNEAIMEKALELVSGLISEYQRIKSLTLLLPYMDEQRKEEILEQALELAFNLKDKGMKDRPSQLLFHIWMNPGKKKLVTKQFILNTRLNPNIFVGEPLLFCEE